MDPGRLMNWCLGSLKPHWKIRLVKGGSRRGLKCSQGLSTTEYPASWLQMPVFHKSFWFTVWARCVLNMLLLLQRKSWETRGLRTDWVEGVSLWCFTSRVFGGSGILGGSGWGSFRMTGWQRTEEAFTLVVGHFLYDFQLQMRLYSHTDVKWHLSLLLFFFFCQYWGLNPGLRAY
jgi:hypothetical protein